MRISRVITKIQQQNRRSWTAKPNVSRSLSSYGLVVCCIVCEY